MSFIERIIKQLAPHLCIICGIEGKIMCDACRLSCVSLESSSCFMCNKFTQGYKTCSKCRKRVKIGNLWAASDYSGVVKSVIGELKFKNKREAAVVLGDTIADALPPVEFDIVAYIPSATTRARRRGFDHTELIAKRVGRAINVPTRRLLSNTVQSRQVGSSKKERIEHMQNAFRLCVHPYVIENKRILIVDDVVSTGATLMGASRILKNCGAKEVCAAVAAKNRIN